ncbi:SDR family oxidoreductase [Neisseria mucosa]|uniref:SDR family oxidoreductase n=1 Tax=Neisseria mucosa TaxID=488 RepID=UPI00280BE540|nr:SDR family oxidoreductase [Neisseria mucosa]
MSSLLNLNNKTAAVIGASSGIGRAVALLLAEHGANVVLCARRADKLEETAALIRARGGRAVAVAGDAALLETHEAAEREFGGLDIAVNNAGIIGAYKPLADISPDEWRDTLDGNLTAAFLGARSQIPLMLARGGGAIVFTSSFVGTSCALPNKTAYGCAKAALAALAKGITADYAAQGIRANALLPGGTDTEMMTTDPQQRAWAEGLHAVKRIARPEEIAAAILFLVSPMGSFVTGTALFADGGNSAVK